MNMLPYSGFPALPDKMEDMHKQLIALGLDDVEALTARIKKCEDWVDNVEETELTGNPVEFQNALAVPAKSLITSINAIQDLHGYDHPWVGGRGKNKFENNYSSLSSAGITYTVNSDGTLVVTGTASNISSYSFGGSTRTIKAGSYVLNGCPSGGNSSTYELQIVTGGNTYRDYGSGVAFTVESDSTYILQILVRSGYACPTGGVLFKPMIRLSTESDASFAPYSNICPISGRDSVVVNVDGANKFDKTTVIDKTYINLADGALVTETYTGWVTSQPIAITGGSIKFSGNNNASANTVRYRTLNSSGTVLRYGGFPANTESGSLTAETGEVGIQFCIRTDSIDTFSVITESSSATIQLGTTVYGADINWDTGVASVLRRAYDMGELNYEYLSDNNAFRSTSALPDATTENVFINSISSIYKEHQTGMANMTDGEFRVQGGIIYLKDFRFTSASDLKTALSGQTVVYDRATPTTIQLTPTQLEMLKGYNRVSSEDADSLTVKAYTGGPWEPITRAIKKVTNKTKTTKKRRK